MLPTVLLISAPICLEKEAGLINELFECGLERLHFRKKASELSETFKILDQINPKNFSKVVWHGDSSCLGLYPFGGYHGQDHLSSFEGSKSKSVHAWNEIDSCFQNYDYFLLSPFFESISKPGYEGNKELRENPITEYFDKVYAMGGLNSKRILELQTEGLKHFAVLGSVWNSENPIKAMQELIMQFQKHYV